MKTTRTIKSVYTLLMTSGLAFASMISMPVLAEGGSVHHSGQASKHSVLAVGHGVVSSATVASAVVATPIIVAGTVSLAAGSVAVGLGDSIANSAKSTSSHHHHTPLVVTDMIITADAAPNQFIEQQPSPATKNTTTKITTTEVKHTTVHKEQR